MLTRRQFGKAVAGVVASSAASAKIAQLEASGRYESRLGDDGLYRQPWFIDSFLILREDLRETASAGRRFVLLWEQNGCPYCERLHAVNLAHPEINEYLRRHFGILQLNLWGAREVTDFDGEVLAERRLAQKWRVNFTPTIQFFPPAVSDTLGKPGVELEVARMPGYFRPFHFLAMFEFVQARAYERMDFQSYLQEKLAGLRARGVKPEVW